MENTASDICIFLREDYLKTDCIELECAGYGQAEDGDFERLDREQDDSNLIINVHRDTGLPLLIALEEFRNETLYAVEMLREHPLPWSFSLPQLSIEAKPLDDVLFAVWEKYKGIKMVWE